MGLGWWYLDKNSMRDQGVSTGQSQSLFPGNQVWAITETLISSRRNLNLEGLVGAGLLTPPPRTVLWLAQCSGMQPVPGMQPLPAWLHIQSRDFCSLPSQNNSNSPVPNLAFTEMTVTRSPLYSKSSWQTEGFYFWYRFTGLLFTERFLKKMGSLLCHR